MMFQGHTKALAVALLAGTASAIDLNINDERKSPIVPSAFETY